MLKPILSFISIFTLLSIHSICHADINGLINKSSKFSVSQTVDRLETILKEKGITVITRWSHSQHAKEIGVTLRPTELILFGNPKLGSQLFTSNQTAGIDLPMKALAWEDDKGQVWLSYNAPSYISQRHDINDRVTVINKMTNALNKLTDSAAGK